ncbi:MAG: hypothetical protein LBL04_13580 [Bacteroidales bacterium]|jgi:hypothetical protein|nr:hypothetical protein [Bacteroidales bacterium]
MKKRISIIAMLCLCYGTVIAQTDAPEWYKNTPVSLLPNVTFAGGMGYTVQEAFTKALADAIGSSANMTVSAQSISDMNSGNEIMLPAINKKVKRMLVERTPLGMIYVLIAIQKDVTLPPNFDWQVFTDKYAFSPRVFVPGMAQLHKGSKTKGILFIAGEAAFIGGVVAAESMRASYESKIGSTHNPASKQDYIDRADMCSNVRNMAVAGAVALYVWNIIDGIAARGDVHLRLVRNAGLKITSYAHPYADGGIMLSLNF